MTDHEIWVRFISAALAGTAVNKSGLNTYAYEKYEAETLVSNAIKIADSAFSVFLERREEGLI